MNDFGIIDDLINEVIKASKIDRNDDNNEVDMLWNKVFDKKIINFMAFLEKIKSTNPLKLMNLIIGFLNKNNLRKINFLLNLMRVGC